MYKFAMDCTALKSVPRLYTDNVTNFVYAFYGCTALQEIDCLITNAATTLGECFHNCSSLVAIYNTLNVSSLTSQMDSTFTGFSNWSTLRFFSGTLRVDFWLSGAPKLTVVLCFLFSNLRTGFRGYYYGMAVFYTYWHSH